MIACDRGDVVLLGFVFSDESGRKLRPALVITSSAYHRARREIILAAITSNGLLQTLPGFAQSNPPKEGAKRGTAVSGEAPAGAVRAAPGRMRHQRAEASSAVQRISRMASRRRNSGSPVTTGTFRSCAVAAAKASA